MPDYTAKADILRQRLRELESVIIAFSGGVDSSLLAVVATEELGAKALCITATSPFHSQEEHDRAISIAENFNLNHRIVKTTEHEDEKVIQNPEDRCYHCKRIIFLPCANWRTEKKSNTLSTAPMSMTAATFALAARLWVNWV